MATSWPQDIPQGSQKARLLATLGTLDIKPEIRAYTSGTRDPDHGVFCKNILLKDRKGQFYLLTFQEDKSLDLKKLKKDLNAYRNFSFASSEELLSLLGVEPGFVSPFGLMFDTEQAVKFVLDEDLLHSRESLNFHPFNKTETCLMSAVQLQLFCKSMKRHIHVVKC